VYDTLKKDGDTVSIVQNPTISLPDDVAVTKRTLAAQDGPAILVGHSCPGPRIASNGFSGATKAADSAIATIH
jgi:hypothetical protein